MSATDVYDTSRDATPEILSRSRSLWVISRHYRRTSECPLYPRKRTSS